MKRLRIYIDTSVIGGCLDDEFTEDSRALLDLAKAGEVSLLISDLLLDELVDAPLEVSELLESLSEALSPENLERVERSQETERLRDQYLEAAVLGVASADDAHHVAIATVAKADLIVSWNFKHIVHFEKIRGFNAVNLREGYTATEIRSPKEVV